jgi:hypothetical protein
MEPRTAMRRGAVVADGGQAGLELRLREAKQVAHGIGGGGDAGTVFAVEGNGSLRDFDLAVFEERAGGAFLEIGGADFEAIIRFATQAVIIMSRVGVDVFLAVLRGDIVEVDHGLLGPGDQGELFFGHGVEGLEVFHVLGRDGSDDADIGVQIGHEVRDFARRIGADFDNEDIVGVRAVEAQLHLDKYPDPGERVEDVVWQLEVETS